MSQENKVHIAYVTIINGNPSEKPEGIDELAKYISVGFKPFGVTGYMTLRQPKGVLTANQQPVPVYCERIWLMSENDESLSKLEKPE